MKKKTEREYQLQINEIRKQGATISQPRMTDKGVHFLITKPTGRETAVLHLSIRDLGDDSMWEIWSDKAGDNGDELMSGFDPGDLAHKVNRAAWMVTGKV